MSQFCASIARCQGVTAALAGLGSDILATPVGAQLLGFRMSVDSRRGSLGHPEEVRRRVDDDFIFHRNFGIRNTHIVASFGIDDLECHAVQAVGGCRR